jgi:hypothetical protein
MQSLHSAVCTDGHYHVAAAEGCQQLPNCYKAELDGGMVCLPKWIQKASTEQFESFYDSLIKLDTKVYGSCEAACWLRQVRAWADDLVHSFAATAVLGLPQAHIIWRGGLPEPSSTACCSTLVAATATAAAAAAATAAAAVCGLPKAHNIWQGRLPKRLSSA